MNPLNIKIIENFITEEQEKELLDFIPKGQERKRVSRNRILRYGADVAYKNNLVSAKIPAIFDQFRDKVDFDSVTINEYFAGQFINWHKDNKDAGDVITVLSLLSDATMKFRSGKGVLEYPLPRRSLVSFSDELRWDWEHYVKADDKRYSIVFRKS